MARKPQSKNSKKSGAWTKRDAKTGRFVSSKADSKPLKRVSREATEFAERFTKKYRDTLRELSKH